jgi:hypothetical protein
MCTRLRLERGCFAGLVDCDSIAVVEHVGALSSSHAKHGDSWIDLVRRGPCGRATTNSACNA